MTSIVTLAEREKTAEASRRRADQEWRTAWWDLTVALGGADDLGQAMATVQEVTGHTEGYLRARAKAGVAVSEIPMKTVRRLPPRKTVELIRQKVTLTPAVLTDLLEDTRTLRDLSAEHSGKAWADTPEGLSTESIVKVVQAQPAIVAQAVIDSLPEGDFRSFADAVFEGSVRRTAGEVGLRVNQHQQTVPDPQPEWVKFCFRIASDAKAVDELIIGFREEGRDDLVADASRDLRQTLLDALTRLDVQSVPDDLSEVNR